MERLALLALAALAALVLLGGEPAPDARPASERPAGTLVFLVHPNRLVAIDVATGRRTVRRVRSVASCGPEMHVTGGHVVFAGVQETRTVVFSVPVALDRAPTRLGAAHAFVPSAVPGRVWLAGVDCDRPAMTGVREVTVDGLTTRESDRRVPGQWLAGAVEGGLVVVRGREQFVWDPGGSARRLPLEAVTEARGNLVAGCREPTCDVAIVDTATRRAVMAHQPPGRRLDIGGAFSPDGSLLAVPAVARERWSVAVVDTGAGTTRLVRGTRSGADYPELSWSESSGWLFVRAGHDRIRAYRPGARRAVTLPIRPPRRALGFAAG